ncbi:MAG: substrate-binding domain-containing protein [Clostridia bacterium]|nr:substrate-binding domain-containing protein [Clostridia bacterium]
MKKRLVSLLVVVMACAFLFAACSSDDTAASESPAAEATEEASAEATEAPSEEATEAASEEASADAEETEAAGSDADNSALNIQVVAKGFQHQFWQVVKDGAEAAKEDLGVGTMDFVGPEGESAINDQVEMLNAALAKNPSAIVLAALDTEAVTSQLQEAVSKNIPIVGFDSGVPDAPEGAIKATASTDNEAAASLAADMMMQDSTFADKVKNATPEAPVVIGVLSQDATSASIIGRTTGFINGLKALAENDHPGQVAVQGHQMYEEAGDGSPAVIIQVQVPPTPDAGDMRNGAQALLGTDNLIGVFCSNEGAVTGLLNATNDGADLNKETGTYKDLVVAGFDAGSTQKAAVRDGAFLGSVTQDPYQIGYQGVALAVKAANGETVEDVDTGAKWYTSANMDDADIADLIYD